MRDNFKGIHREFLAIHGNIRMFNLCPQNYYVRIEEIAYARMKRTGI